MHTIFILANMLARGPARGTTAFSVSSVIRTNDSTVISSSEIKITNTYMNTSRIVRFNSSTKGKIGKVRPLSNKA